MAAQDEPKNADIYQWLGYVRLQQKTPDKYEAAGGGVQNGGRTETAESGGNASGTGPRLRRNGKSGRRAGGIPYCRQT